MNTFEISNLKNDRAEKPGQLGSGRANYGRPNHCGVASMNISRAALARKSQAARGYNLPRNGNVFPRQKLTSEDVAKAQGEVLSGVFGKLKSPAKELANKTGQTERACRNHISGANCMHLAEFFNASQDVPELRAWGLKMLGADAPAAPASQEIVLRIDASALTGAHRHEA